MAVKCNGCGAEFEKRGNYCPFCGCDIGDMEENKPVEATKDIKNLASYIVGLLMAILVIVLLIIFCVRGCDGNDRYDDDLDEEIVLVLPKTASGVLINYGEDNDYLYDDNAGTTITAKVKVEKVERVGTIRYDDDNGFVELKLTVTMLYNSQKGIAESSYVKYKIKNSSGVIIDIGRIYVPEIDEGDTVEFNHLIGDFLSVDDSYEMYFYN